MREAFNILPSLLLVVIHVSKEYDAKLTPSSMVGMLPSVTNKY